MDEPFIVPNLKAGTEMWQNIQTMGRLNSPRIVVTLDKMHEANIVAVIEEIDAIQGHASS
jgi:hypothetical protein